MKRLGSLATLVGVFGLMLAVLIDTTVDAGVGIRVYNLELMEHQLVVFLLFLVVALVGVGALLLDSLGE